ncbi:MAG TPA: TIGR03854 family LLM class F420-dependent oxidoreductase [Pseudonocardiaceae bacterium]|nr:TIGR03854 family LLM class F420-dependent oxidoreductase [Pseudonocardiaceae bacterium]
MKVRFGVGLGAGTAPAEFGGVVDRLERLGIDSLWLSEQVYSAAVDPFVGLAYALSRTSALKVGTSVAVLPGRHPVLVAKQLASLAALAPKRVLPVFGLRPARSTEHGLFPVPQGRRAAVFDESLRLLKSLLSNESVDFDGEFFSVGSARIGPLPAKPLDIWLGGTAPGGLRRVGRFGDGWLGSFLSPVDAGRAVTTIKAAAAEAGREIEEDHFGISLSLAEDGISDELAAVLRQRNPHTDPRDLIATSWSELHRQLDGYLANGLTKFVLYHRGPGPFDEFADRFAAELLPRQN